MPKNIFFLAFFIFIFNLVELGYGQLTSKVSDSPHNMRKATQGSMAHLGLQDYGDVCVYCHISHESSMKTLPRIWNRVISEPLYRADKTWQTNKPIARDLDDVSLVCLSCHDGTLPLDAVKYLPTGMQKTDISNVTIQTCASECHTPSNPSGDIIFSGKNFSTNLHNIHPVGIEYNFLKNTKLHAPSHGKVNSLPLYGPNTRQVGCGSCHDPHDNSNGNFLRMANTNSALCMACHKN